MLAAEVIGRLRVVNLSELIDAHRAGRSYPELERDCGGRPSAKRLQQLARSPIKNFPDPPTVRALARGLKVSQSVVVLAAAESLGLDVRRPSARLIDLLPAGASQLTELQAAAVAHLVATIVDPVDPVVDDDAADQSIEPTVTSVLAARERAVDEQGKLFGGDWVAALTNARRSDDPALARLIPELDERAEAQLEEERLEDQRLPSAARKGTPRLRSVKQQQDEAGEAPDPEGPEGGA